ncbi:MAG: phosphodiester glycosidase family protein [Erysipelotrichales bacterium]|nr:MAG: phosphodiester glycosidase family protein [Erysipelotrichales bacterium]
MKTKRIPYLWAYIVSLILVTSILYVLLDAFLIPKSLVVVDPTENPVCDVTPGGTQVDKTVDITDTSYSESQTVVYKNITIEKVQENGYVYYVADIQLSNPAYLRTAFAKNTFGRNINQYTSTIAKNNKAILAINGDFYGFRDKGLIIRNGVLYRDNPRSPIDNRTLIIDKNGDFKFVTEGEVNGESLVAEGVTQSFSFGPVLIENGKLVDTSKQYWVAAKANPRVGIGQIGPLHYLFVVVDGRTGTSDGMTLPQLAQVLYDRGAITAYNLDGGGSSTMFYNGKVINRPTTDGNNIGERGVSDIIYITGK